MVKMSLMMMMANVTQCNKN